MPTPTAEPAVSVLPEDRTARIKSIYFKGLNPKHLTRIAGERERSVKRWLGKTNTRGGAKQDPWDYSAASGSGGVPWRRRRQAAARFSRSISALGVTTSVNTVAKVRPKAMAVDSWRHHWVEGAPI